MENEDRQPLEIGDPRKYWLCKLIDNLEFLGDLRFNGEWGRCTIQMNRIVGGLNAQAQTEINEKIPQIKRWMTKFDATPGDVEKAIDDLNAYLNENYLQEVKSARPKFEHKTEAKM